MLFAVLHIFYQVAEKIHFEDLLGAVGGLRLVDY
jgi:hypothetical protein